MLLLYYLFVRIGRRKVRYQSKSAISYIFRNFWKLVVVALPAAVLMAFFFNFSAETELYKRFVLGTLTTEEFWEFMNAFSVLKYVPHWWQSLIAFAVLICVFCLMLVKIDVHMRSGNMPILPVRRSVRVIPVMALYSLVCFAAMEAVMLIPVGIMFLIRSVNSVYALVPVCFALVFSARVLLSYLFAALIIAFPMRFRENYRFNTALSYSVRATSKNKKYLWAFSLGYPSARLVTGILAKLAESVKADIAVYALFWLFLIMYVPALSFKLYHDSIGIERRDIDQIMFG